jgi:hypothetical protein
MIVLFFRFLYNTCWADIFREKVGDLNHTDTDSDIHPDGCWLFCHEERAIQSRGKA